MTDLIFCGFCCLGHCQVGGLSFEVHFESTLVAFSAARLGQREGCWALPGGAVPLSPMDGLAVPVFHSGFLQASPDEGASPELWWKFLNNKIYVSN